jgi:hypothetical protein
MVLMHTGLTLLVWLVCACQINLRVNLNWWGHNFEVVWLVHSVENNTCLLKMFPLAFPYLCICVLPGLVLTDITTKISIFPNMQSCCLLRTGYLLAFSKDEGSMFFWDVDLLSDYVVLHSRRWYSLFLPNSVASWWFLFAVEHLGHQL